MPSITEIVVAVPISTKISGAPYSCKPATAQTIISLPTCAGLSVLIFNPVFIPGPTTFGLRFTTFCNALLMVFNTGGTTEEMITPSMSFTSILFNSNTCLKLMAYSNSVLEWSVDILSTK